MKANISELFSFLQMIIVICGFIISVRQLLLLHQQLQLMTEEIHSQIDWQKKDATFNYLNIYINQLKDINIKLEKKIDILKQNGHAISISSMSNQLIDENTRAELFHLVSYFENLAIGISHNYFNEAIAQGLLNNVVISTYKSLTPYLLLRRNETGLNVGSNFEKLARRWSIS